MDLKMDMAKDRDLIRVMAEAPGTEDRNTTAGTDRVTTSDPAMAAQAADLKTAGTDPDRKDPNTDQVLKAPVFAISVATVDSTCHQKPSDT